MKKQMIVGIAIAAAMLSFGALSASAADSDSSAASCADKQAYQQFVQETAGLADKLKKTDWELREQYSPDSIDNNKVRELEEDQKELKNEINAAAQKYSILTCCRS